MKTYPTISLFFVTFNIFSQEKFMFEEGRDSNFVEYIIDTKNSDEIFQLALDWANRAYPYAGIVVSEDLSNNILQ